MLRAILNVSWDDFLTNSQLYGKLAKIADVIKERRLGHISRNKEELLLWVPLYGQKSSGIPQKTYLDQLASDSGPCCDDEQTWLERSSQKSPRKLDTVSKEIFGRQWGSS